MKKKAATALCLAGFVMGRVLAALLTLVEGSPFEAGVTAGLFDKKEQEGEKDPHEYPADRAAEIVRRMADRRSEMVRALQRGQQIECNCPECTAARAKMMN